MSLQSRRRDERCLSDLALDRLIAGDASDEQQTLARAHRDACDACRARWDELSRQRDAALPALSPRAAHVRTPVPQRRARRLRCAAAAVAACCAVFLFQRLTPLEPGERVKGGGRLGFFVQRGGELSRGGPGELLHPGDTLQLTFFAPGAGYLVVLGRDARGALSVYYPSGAHAARVEPGEQTLPESTLLDDTLGEETIEAVFCKTEHDVEALRAAHAAAATLEGCSIDIVRVTKGAP